MYYDIRVHPYAHPQHIKVLKHFVYIQYRCGMRSLGFLSLNHDIITSLGLIHTPIIQKSTVNLNRHNSVRMHPYAHSQHIKVLKHYVYIQHGCGMQSEASCSLIHDTPTSLGLAHTPIFQKFHPYLHRYYSVRGASICSFTSY
jgi:hypothetical protein